MLPEHVGLRVLKRLMDKQEDRKGNKAHSSVARRKRSAKEIMFCL